LTRLYQKKKKVRTIVRKSAVYCLYKWSGRCPHSPGIKMLTSSEPEPDFAPNTMAAKVDLRTFLLCR
jgi:hypothetical protein